MNVAELKGVEIMRTFLETSPFAVLLGLRADRLEADLAELTLPYRDDLATMGDVVHGGAISTLIDTAATAASWCTDEVPESLRGATAALSVTFTAAGRGTDLVAVARVVRRGRNLCFVDVDVTGDGELVAKGLVTYRLG